MKKIFTFILILISEFCCSQNLVPNPSFEQYDTCPNDLGQINYAIGWSSYRGTPDYFNTCAPDTPLPYVSVSVPSNYLGYQNAKTGNAYAGLATFSKVGINAREFIGMQLNQTLLIGQKYFASFYVNRAVSRPTNANVATNKIGMRLSTMPYSNLNGAPIDNFAHVYTDSVITDSLNWTKISGSFIADFAYQYISFGNFFADSLTTSIRFDSSAVYAYYFFDEIRLSTDSNYVNSINEFTSLNLTNVYPNPARDWIVVEGRNIFKLSLYDVLGQLCFSKEASFSSLQKINISSFNKGIYFLRIETSSENTINKVVLE